MNKSEQINELAAALAKAQGSMESARKDSENPFFKSHYADLAAVWDAARKPLTDNGLSVTQHPSADGNIVTVETSLLHASGQWVGSQLTMLSKDASPQAIGSCITYLRRYALSSVLGIASEDDDDGNSAQPKQGHRVEPAPAPKASPKPGKPLTMATTTTRAAALDRLGCQEDGPAKDTLKGYLVALGWLEESKNVEQWPCRFVPITSVELEAIRTGMANFSQTGKAVMPYQPHGIDPNTLKPKAPQEPEWKRFVMPFGKGKGKTLGQLAPEELGFYMEQFKPRETVDVQQPDGSIVTQPLPAESIESQKALRVALDQAAEDLNKKG
jgi:hypothetical protein